MLRPNRSLPSGSTEAFRLRAFALGLLLAAAAATSASASATQAVPTKGHPRITNGVTSLTRPTTGSLLRKNGINYGLTCSGTLIGCHTFLTAAHCVCAGSPFSACGTPSPAGFAVYLQNVGLVDVTAINVDPTYDFAVQGDVAVLTLATDIEGVPPTPLNTTMRIPHGTTVDIAGYGLTQGGAADTGILREGQAVTDGCQGEATDAAHVCWLYDTTVGAPGVDSNTCNGDSGGPLFVDFGGGELVAGITSGGVSANCLPTDVSYDTDVFVHSAYIQSIGGVDLNNSVCGSASQVGDVDTQETTLSYSTFDANSSACRKEVRKQYARYTGKALLLRQRCLNSIGRGDFAGPCPDADTSLRLAALVAKVSPTKIANKCPDIVVPTMGTELGCVGSVDAGDLASCLIAAADGAIDSMLAAQYADDAPSAAIADDGARTCQEGLARALGSYAKSALKAETKCEGNLDLGKTASCPDLAALTALTKAELKANDSIVASCSDSEVEALSLVSAFGGLCSGATSVADLQNCEPDEHGTALADVTGILDSTVMPTTMTVSVPAGASRLVIAMNGRRKTNNDLDIYTKLGSAPTTSVFDGASENGGMFEEIEIASPAAGVWHVLIARYSGDANVAFQLTATVFKP